MKRFVSLLLLALAETVSPARAADSRPNILYCVADDASWAHFGPYGDKVIHTPVFDRIAREGVRFNHAYCGSPSCTPSRGAMLTGQNIWRLEEAGNLWSTLQKKFPNYVDLLEASGYTVGLQGKGWSPGDPKPGGYTRNPAGPSFKNFEAFLKTVPEGKPFCFWYGSHDPHRPYVKGSGVQSGMKLEDVKVPPMLPDSPEVRGDILDYYFAIQRYDHDCGEIIKLLEARGLLENTIVVITSDNGMPFPRDKANLYDYGTRMPLAIRWTAKFKGGRVIDDFVSHTDLAPTFLEAAGLKPPADMTGHSLLGILTSEKSGIVEPSRDKVFFGRERHASVRPGNVGYPARAIRTRDFLYIRNFDPDRWPAGDPPEFGDIDDHHSVEAGPSKKYLLEYRDSTDVKRFFELACGKRPAEELYDLKKDPGELDNVAARPEYAVTKAKLRETLDRYLTETKDPRMIGGGEKFDQYPYYPVKAGENTLRKNRSDVHC